MKKFIELFLIFLGVSLIGLYFFNEGRTYEKKFHVCPVAPNFFYVKPGQKINFMGYDGTSYALTFPRVDQKFPVTTGVSPTGSDGKPVHPRDHDLYDPETGDFTPVRYATQ